MLNDNWVIVYLCATGFQKSRWYIFEDQSGEGRLPGEAEIAWVVRPEFWVRGVLGQWGEPHGGLSEKTLRRVSADDNSYHMSGIGLSLMWITSGNLLQNSKIVC